MGSGKDVTLWISCGGTSGSGESYRIQDPTVPVFYGPDQGV